MGVATRLMATGALVSNTYATCLLQGDNPEKFGLIPLRRGSERKVPHTGTETRTRLLREAAVRNIGQWAEA